jgi:hypothetical protein
LVFISELVRAAYASARLAQKARVTAGGVGELGLLAYVAHIAGVDGARAVALLDLLGDVVYRVPMRVHGHPGRRGRRGVLLLLLLLLSARVSSFLSGS